jgi:AraC-like DNA-binding protein
MRRIRLCPPLGLFFDEIGYDRVHMSPSPAEPTYLVRVVRLLLDDAVRAGANRETLVSGLGLDAKILEEPDARLPLGRVAALVREVVAGDPSFGLRAGASRKTKDAGLIGYAMLHSATLRAALTRLVRYGRIMGDHNRIELEESGSTATITFEGHPVLEAIHGYTELSVAWLISGLREITATDLTAREVRLPYPEPSHSANLRAFFRCMIQFEAPHTAIVLKRGDLDLRVVGSDVTLVGYLDKLAEDAVKSLSDQDSIVGRLRQVLWSSLSDGPPTLAAASTAMALSPRTLQRRLRDEGTTFAEALASLRQELAVRLLEDRSLAVYEVGFLLGYGDPTAFHRAFRRWRGLSPKRFREQGRVDPLRTPRFALPTPGGNP